MAELALGAIALYVWLNAQSGLVSAFAFNVILIAGVSTLLVNGNPLMRYDGYFILCDVLELPNLAQRATQYWAYIVDRYAFGAREAQPPMESAGECGLLLVYGAIAPLYRLGITIGLIWFVAGEYFFIGVLLALLGAWTAFVMPLWRGWKHLIDSPALARRREAALRRSGLALLGLVGFVALVPLPFHSIEQAVVWLPDAALVRAEGTGHVSETIARAGQTLRRGEPILVLDSPPLVAELGVAAAALAQVQAQLRKAEIDDQVRAQSLRAELAARTDRLADVERRFQGLSVAAATEGRWTQAAPTELAGRFVKRGEVLGYVVGGPSTLVRAAVPQEDMDLIRSRLQGVEVRLAGNLREPVAGRLRRQVPGGEFDLVSPALGTSGGGDIAVDPSQPGGTRSLKRVFDVEVEMERPSPGSVFGDRAYVRFDLGWAPLGWQAFMRLRQLFLARLNV
jgi:putative peptide zinc metalloprotease protein